MHDVAYCDLVYATERSVFSFPFIDLGLTPETAFTLLLPELTGHQRAAELMLFGERFDARTALAVGIVRAVVPDQQALTALVAERTAALAAKPRAALLATRALLRDRTTPTVGKRMALDREVFRDLIRARAGSTSPTTSP